MGMIEPHDEGTTYCTDSPPHDDSRLTPSGFPQCLEVPRFVFDHPTKGYIIRCQMQANHDDPLHADLYIARDGTRTVVRWQRLL